VSPFEYVAASSVEDVLALLARHGGDAKVLAGGQSLLPILNYRLARPRVVVDVNDLPLDELRVENGRLRLGALVRHATLASSPLIARECPILADAAALVGNVRVRTLGTLGGSLAHADPAAELPLVMIALDAEYEARSARGARTIAARDFTTGVLSTALAPDELLTAIEVPVTGGMGWAVEEFSRRPGDFAMVAVATLVKVDARGRVEEARLAVGGVGPKPARVPVAEDVLRGHEPSSERIAQAAERLRAAIDPASDAFASATYRRLLAGVLTRRALVRAVGRSMSAPTSAGEPVARTARKTTATAPGVAPATTRLVINGRPRDVDVDPHRTLLEVLRDTLGIFDAKEGCNEGVCGACTVLLDGRPVSSCLVLAASTRGRAITTVRGLTPDGELHPLQEAFLRHGAVQCGFCTPGMLLTALAFLEENARADREAIRVALEGNLCRCTGYTKIVDAIEEYARGAEARRG
jgi:carbon-monoxide dehydrogenase medium subunit